jgi:hypothetical protein
MISLAALVVHLPLLLMKLPLKSYDANFHIFFASHYLHNWFDPWNPKCRGWILLLRKFRPLRGTTSPFQQPFFSSASLSGVDIPHFCNSAAPGPEIAPTTNDRASVHVACFRFAATAQRT